MRKLIYLLALLPFLSIAQSTQPLKAPNGLVVTGTTIAPSAYVDIQGTAKGFLTPRLNTTQQNAISSPATGLLIFNTTTGLYTFYNGSAWVSVGGGGSGYDSLQAMYDVDWNKLIVFSDLNALGLYDIYTGYADTSGAQSTLAIKSDDGVNFRGEAEVSDNNNNHAARLKGDGSVELSNSGNLAAIKSDNIDHNVVHQAPNADGTYAVSASNGLLTATTDTEGNLDLSGLIVGSSSVTSVNGQTGVVSLAGSDIPNTPAGNIAATNTQAAINELDSEKQPTITGAATTITGSNLTANRAVISNGSGKVAVSAVTDIELGYVAGATSNLQAQINAKGSGTVTNVTSANTDIAVATGTTTPVITLNSGTGANQIVKRDGSGNIPDLSNYVNKTVANTYTAGAKQTFLPSSTFAGLNIGSITATPSTLLGGDIFYNSNTGNIQYYDAVISSTRTLVTLSQTQVLSNKDLTAVTNIFPTFNQNTTGSAATLTTPRTIGILTGDASTGGSAFNGSANNTNALTLATVNSNVGTFGSATQVPQVTVNGKGLATAASNVAIQIGESQVNNLVTDLAAKAPLASPALTGAPTAPTAAANTNNTQLATTAFIQSALSGYERIVSKSATQSTAVTATTSETITLSVLIPAGTYSVGDFMNINAPLTKTGTAGTCLFKMYINTVASIPAGTQQVGQMNLTGSNISSGFSRRFAFLSGGLVNCYPPTQNSASDDAGASALARSSTIVASTTADMYIVITATPSSVSDTSRIDNYVITKY